MPSPPLSPHSLIFPSAATSISSTLTSLKRAKLSITNRLHSIHSDASFVLETANHFDLPLVANERCGSWYVPPERKQGSAYFKSTDGHAGQWAFNLRRLNLQVLEVVGEGRGCIIVDSTRRGKSVPDALSKTAPIWIAVMNRLLFPELTESHRLRTPEDVVSASEHTQIDTRLAGFVQDARGLDLDLSALRAKLRRPMRAVWITPETGLDRVISTDDDHAHVVLCTASSRASDNSKLGAAYVQGAADDSEAWACGLNAVTFWANAEALLDTLEDALPDIIVSLMEKSTTSSRLPRRISPAHPLAVSDDASLLDPRSKLQDYDVIVCIAVTLPATMRDDAHGLTGKVIHLPCGTGKLGSRDLRLHLAKLEKIPRFEAPVRTVLVTCDTGRDLSVGAALAVLCMYFDNCGDPTLPLRQPVPSKVEIKKRLSWIMASIPDVSPSRATLQSVNAYLMG
ncbi:tRNA A64-2'-O-ribosylphosphate transferase [Oleoguttula sp. CCFEE 5521]